MQLTAELARLLENEKTMHKLLPDGRAAGGTGHNPRQGPRLPDHHQRCGSLRGDVHRDGKRADRGKFDAPLFPGNFVTTSTLIPAFNATSAGLVTGANGTPDYNRTQSGSITGTFDDLQLYSNGSGATENFDLGTAAFAGTSTFDFSAYASVLPANATTGLIYAGSGDIFTATPVVIGSYQVIQAAAPEPRQWALMLVGGLALVLVCRFRGSSQGVVQG
jgi:hypothetical protein